MSDATNGGEATAIDLLPFCFWLKAEITTFGDVERIFINVVDFDLMAFRIAHPDALLPEMDQMERAMDEFRERNPRL